MASAWDGATARVSGHRLRRRTGTVFNYAEDAHLRDDLPCGCALCETCDNDAGRIGDGRIDGTPVGTPLAPDATHYLVPDATSIAEYVDFLEMRDAAKNIILLQSEARQVHRRGNTRLSKRLRDVYNDRRRSLRLFPNEHCVHTSVVAARDERAPSRWLAPSSKKKEFAGDTAVSMNEDAGVSHTPANPTFSVFHDPVLRAAAWYAGKVRGAFPVVILSDDRASTLNGGVNLDVNLASEMRRRLPPGVEVLAADEYFPRFHSNDVDVMNAFESVREANEAAMKADEERKLLGLGFDAGEGGNRARAFAPHWDNDAIVGGLESGELMRGTIKVCRWRPEEATVRVGEDEERTDAADDGNDNTLETFGDVLVPSRTLRNRALDGDGVAVRLLPRSRWVPAEGAHTVAEGNSDSDSDSEEDDTNGDEEKAGADDKKRTKRRLVPTAEVVGVLRRRGADIVATIAEDKAPEGARTRSNNARSNSVLVIPMDRRFPRCRLLTRRADALAGQRLVVRITRWPAHSKHPEARVVRALGKCGDLTAEVNALLAEHDIETNAFSPGALKELPRVDWKISADELKMRRDMRSHRTMSIDPPGCTDVDDAVSVRRVRLPPGGDVDRAIKHMGGGVNGGGVKHMGSQTQTGEYEYADDSPESDRLDDKFGYEVAVHIADVSHFVEEGSVLDLEARARGTTVYLTDGRIDMLPAVLSENLCSLIGGADRLAVSCMWTLDSNFNVVGVPWFGRSVIRSNHQLNYYQAQAILDGRSPPTNEDDLNDVAETGNVRKDLEVVANFSRVMNAERTKFGAVELASAELRFETSSDGVPLAVLTKGEVPMMRVVAELMIAANAAVATRVFAHTPAYAFVRRHAPPRLDGFDELRRLLGSCGVVLDASNGAALARSLDDAKKRLKETAGGTPTDGVHSADALFRGVATRAMSEAQYCVTGGAPPSDGGGHGHYGLALALYTHFTSPIRRYADVVAHRQLLAAVGGAGEGGAEATGPESNNTNTHSLAQTATHLNERNRAAKRAQQRCSELYLLEHLARTPLVERAVVHEVKDDGVAVFVPRFHVRGVVRLLRRARDGRGLIGVKNGNSVITDDDLGAVLPALDTSFEKVADTSGSWMRLEPAPEATPGITLERKGESLGWTYSASYGQTPSHALPPLPKPLRVLQPVWVQLSCERSAARGPTLVTTLLDESHPSVAVAKRKSEIETPTKDVDTHGQLSASPSAASTRHAREVDELARGLRDTDLNGDRRVPKEVHAPEVKVLKQSRRETNAETARRALIENAEIKGKGTVSSRSVCVSTAETRDSSVMDQELRDTHGGRVRWWRAQARAALAAMRASATRGASARSAAGENPERGVNFDEEVDPALARLERRKRRAACESLRAQVERRRLEEVD